MTSRDGEQGSGGGPVEGHPGSTGDAQGGAAGRRCGFVALIGAPNAGKSTLVNAMVGTKVTIVSPKVQTTRTVVRAIAIFGDSQVVFVDTPGLFQPRRRLDRAMVSAAWSGAADADLIVLVVDVTRPKVVDVAQETVNALRKSNRQAVLCLNKIDRIARPKLLTIAARLNESGVFTDTFMVSALTGDGLDALQAHLAAAMPESPWLYPEDQLSDMPMRLLASEITREKLYFNLHEELPYESTVETESWEEFDDGSVKISQVIYVQRDGQKGIVLGEQGRRIKAIRQAAQEELSGMFDRKVHLFLFVKARGRWLDDPERYRALGLDFDA